jgi:hypothetical protein
MPKPPDAPPDDDDLMLGPIPAPDATATPAERAHAKTFAELVDKTLAGRVPPAVSAEERALLEVATVIRAASGGLPLAPSRQRAIVEDALRQAVGEPSASLDAVPISSLSWHARNRRWMPWSVAGATSLVAAAAIAMLALRAPKPAPPQAAAASIPTSWKSRPSDPLIGPIARERAGDAAARLDYIFADRLDAYRERAFAPAGAKP